MSKIALDFSRVTSKWDRAVTTLFMKGIEEPMVSTWLLCGLSKIPGVDLNAREGKSGQPSVTRAMVKKRPRLAFMLANNEAVDPATRDYIGMSPRVLAQRFGMKEVEDVLASRGAPWTAADDQRMTLLNAVDKVAFPPDRAGDIQMALYAIGEEAGDIPTPPDLGVKAKTDRFSTKPRA